MPTSPNGVLYLEVDTPEYEGDDLGVRITRVFETSSVFRFLENLLGEYVITGQNGAVSAIAYKTPAIPHELFPHCFVSSWKCRATLPGALAGTNADTDLLKGQSTPSQIRSETAGQRRLEYTVTVRYTSQFTKNAGEFCRLLSTGNTTGSASLPEGTYLTYERESGGEIQLIPSRVWRWTAAPTIKVPGDTLTGKVIPTTNHVVHWWYVGDPPWDRIDSTIGKVNDTTFLAASAGTVLFIGCQPTPMFRLQQTGAILWKLSYRFTQQTKFLSNGTSKVGWNYFYKEEASGGEHWCEIEDEDGNNPYDAATFANLFKYHHQQT